MGAKKAHPEPNLLADTGAALHAWRSSAVRLVLLVIAGTGLLSWGSAINNDRTLTGLTTFSWIYLAVYITFVLLAVLPRIDYRVRAWGLVVISYINAVASFAKLGLIGSGRLYLLVVPVFSILLLGWRSGLVTTLLSLAVYFTIAYLTSSYQFGEWYRLLENPAQLDRWGESGTALVTFILAVIAMLWSYQRLMQRTLIARQKTSLALEQAYQSLEQRVGERTRELAAVNAIAGVVSGSLNLHEILDAALNKTLEVTGMELGIAYRLETGLPEKPGDGQLIHMVQRGFSERFIPSISPLNVEGSIVQQAAKAGRPVVWQPQNYPNPSIRQAIEKEGVQFGVSIPLQAKGQLVGAMIICSRQPRPMAPEELAMLSSIGQQVALAVENSRLYDQVQQTAQLEERSRLARELHDSVTQSLYSVTLYAEAAARLFDAGDTQTAAEHLRELRDTSREALREMRVLIYELRPPVLGIGGLAGALQTRLDAVEARAGLQTELKVEGTDRLPPAVQEELYHIAREALNNLLKHANAHSVHVYLSFQQKRTILEICDDGVGFHPELLQSSGGFGIAGMKERAQRISAQFEIQSAPGGGTTVRVVAGENGDGQTAPEDGGKNG